MALINNSSLFKWVTANSFAQQLVNSNPNAPIGGPPNLMTTQMKTKNGAPAIRVPSTVHHRTTSTAASTTTTTSATTYVTSNPTGTSSIYDWYTSDPRYAIDVIKEVTLDDVYKAVQSGLLDIQIGGHVDVSRGAQLNLPDGSKLHVQHDGNFKIDDSNAKVTYKSNNVREFNKFMNASDLLEDFIKDLGKVGIKQNQFLNIPIEAFINWLIHRAAEQDGDPPPQDVKLLEDEAQERKHPKCLHCGKFISPDLPAQFCNGDHYQQYIERK